MEDYRRKVINAIIKRSSKENILDRYPHQFLELKEDYYQDHSFNKHLESALHNYYFVIILLFPI